MVLGRRLVAATACAVTGALLLTPIPILMSLANASGLGPLWLRWLEDSSGAPAIIPADKVVHLLLFAALTAVVVWAAALPPRGLTVLRRSAIFVLLYSWLLELLQGLLGVRQAEFLDGLFNALGVGLAVAGLLLAQIWARRLKRPTQEARE